MKDTTLIRRYTTLTRQRINRGATIPAIPRCPPLSPFNAGSRCTVFCILVIIEQGAGSRGDGGRGENVNCKGSGQGMFVVMLGMGGQSTLAGIVDLFEMFLI